MKEVRAGIRIKLGQSDEIVQFLGFFNVLTNTTPMQMILKFRGSGT